LEQKFTVNETLKIPFKKKLQTSVGWVLSKPPKDIKSFAGALEKEGISIVVRKGKENIIYGLTYIDHKNKTVFNGSDLGKQFSANAVLEKFGQDRMIKRDEKISEELVMIKDKVIHQDTKQFEWKLSSSTPHITTPYEPIPYPLRIKKKRKKRRRNL
jgi:hypothetical protein